MLNAKQGVIEMKKNVTILWPSICYVQWISISSLVAIEGEAITILVIDKAGEISEKQITKVLQYHYPCG